MIKLIWLIGGLDSDWIPENARESCELGLPGYPIRGPQSTGTQTINLPLPIGSMYGIFTRIYHRNQPNVGKYMDPMG